MASFRRSAFATAESEILRRIKLSLHIETPLILSQPLSLKSKRRVWLKLEALQPSGSFKLRGVGAVCEAHARQGMRRFISSSGGNAGIAVAYSGRKLGIPVTVVVPETTSARARELIEQEGASIVVYGKSWKEANDQAQFLLDPSAAFIHPFDDPVMWDGHASVIDEVVRAGANFDSVILSVGGGGLLSGVVEGLRRNGRSEVPIVAVETTGADSFARSISSGARIELDAITSIATSLGAKKVSANAFALAETHDIRSIVVSDLDAVNACFSFLDDHRVLVEPACGASLSVLYCKHAALEHLQSPLVIVCGGSTATLPQLLDWRGVLSRV